MDNHPYNLFYRLLLYFFPDRFRLEFADEMGAVFAEAAHEAAQSGALQLARFLFLELVGLLCGAFSVHLQEGDPSTRPSSRPPVWDGPPSRREALIALAVFMLPAAAFFINAGSLPSGGVWVLIGAGFTLAILLAGLLRGLPRWSLPYLGLALSATSFLVLFQWLADLAAPALFARLGPLPRDQEARLILQAFWAGLMWLSLFTLTTLVIGALALLRRFRPLLWRIRQDWTLASYILYSGAMFTLLLAFDQYHYEKSYAIASTLCLATGAWLYLRSPRPWQRSLALLSGLTLAMWSAAAGQWGLAGAQDWAAWTGWRPLEAERLLEAQRELLEWVWMVLFLLAPAMLRLFEAASFWGARRRISQPG